MEERVYIGLDWVPEFPEFCECERMGEKGVFNATRVKGMLIVAKVTEKMNGTGKVVTSLRQVEISENQFFHQFKKVSQ
jgi:hypothetical protein